MLSITVEINPAKSGIDRRCAGAFLRDDSGDILLAHNGRVGGGRPGIGMKAFRDFCSSKSWKEVRYPGGKWFSMWVLGRIGDEDVEMNIGDFVDEVARFKEWATSQ